jgi:hypothetical protein
MLLGKIREVCEEAKDSSCKYSLTLAIYLQVGKNLKT